MWYGLSFFQILHAKTIPNTFTLRKNATSCAPLSSMMSALPHLHPVESKW